MVFSSCNDGNFTWQTWTIGFMIAPALAVFEGVTGAKIVSQKAIE